MSKPEEKEGTMFVWYCEWCMQGHVLPTSGETEEGKAKCPRCEDYKLVLIGKVRTEGKETFLELDKDLAGQYGLAEPSADIMEMALNS